MENWKLAFVVCMALTVIASVIIIDDEIEKFSEVEEYGYEDSDHYDEDSHYGYSDPMCNVAGVMFHGDLATFDYSDPESEDGSTMSTSDTLNAYLQEAEDSENIKVILLEIDSYGGSPVAAQEIVATLEKYVNKPVIAQIREGGVSAAYWVASAADTVFASTMSDVGGIGVTMSYLDEHKLNENEGYTFNQLSTGKFKDSGSFEKPLTAEERALFERDINIIFEEFLASVAKNRELDQETVRKLADGSSMLGKMAKENGLIDEIGGYYEVLDFIKQNHNLEEPIVCWQ